MAEPPYNAAFFDRQRSGSKQAAELVVPIVLDLLAPGSVCDIGCGVGGWLAAFNEHGVEDVLGVDGDYVQRDQLDIPAERFLARDLGQRLALDRRFDLAVSLEVAEHLPPESGPGFIDDLVTLAPAVLFSAAVPNQGGVGHVNERWQEYWEEQFSRSGYVAVDCIRPRIWNTTGIDFWYRQNTLLFVAPALLEKRPKLKEAFERTRSQPLSLVHPRLLEVTVRRPKKGYARLVQMRDTGAISEEEFQRRREVLIESMLGSGASPASANP